MITEEPNPPIPEMSGVIWWKKMNMEEQRELTERTPGEIRSISRNKIF